MGFNPTIVRHKVTDNMVCKVYNGNKPQRRLINKALYHTMAV